MLTGPAFLKFSTCICGAVRHGWVKWLCGVWSLECWFFSSVGCSGWRPWWTDGERRRWELPRGRKQEKHFHNVNTYTCIKLILLQNLFLIEGGGAKGYILYVVFGGSAALVELISIVELILTGGIGEVWHRVWRDGDVSRGGNAAAGAWRGTPWQGTEDAVNAMWQRLFYLKDESKSVSITVNVHRQIPRLEPYYVIFNIVMTSSAECIDRTCSLPT